MFVNGSDTSKETTPIGNKVRGLGGSLLTFVSAHTHRRISKTNTMGWAILGKEAKVGEK